jgi:molybdopterin/thiamine biosynthesis adenylyltransferase
MKLSEVEDILIIGAGGTGSALLPSLCRYLMSQNYGGQVIIADGDSYDLGNASRQHFRPDSIGMNKAEAQAKFLQETIPGFADSIVYIDTFLSKESIEGLITNNTVVFNCVDNNAVRKYVEDVCMQRSRSVHICCGNDLLTGQVLLSMRNNDSDEVQFYDDVYARDECLTSYLFSEQ